MPLVQTLHTSCVPEVKLRQTSRLGWPFEEGCFFLETFILWENIFVPLSSLFSFRTVIGVGVGAGAYILSKFAVSLRFFTSSSRSCTASTVRSPLVWNLILPHAASHEQFFTTGSPPSLLFFTSNLELYYSFMASF